MNHPVYVRVYGRRNNVYHNVNIIVLNKYYRGRPRYDLCPSPVSQVRTYTRMRGEKTSGGICSPSQAVSFFLDSTYN